MSANPTEPQGDGLKADKKMSREEYDALRLKGWHCVRHDHKIPFTTEVIYGVPLTSFPASPEQFAFFAKNSPEQEGGDWRRDVLDAIWRASGNPEAGEPWPGKIARAIAPKLAALTPKPSEEQRERVDTPELQRLRKYGYWSRPYDQGKETANPYDGMNPGQLSIDIGVVLSPPKERIAEGWRPTGAVQDIAAERQRQISAEGWTREHDEAHGNGDLLRAAVCYAQRRMDEDRFGQMTESAPAAWPWGLEWWKPKDRRRDLVRAAALIAAEIDRLDGLAAPPASDGGQ